MTRAIEARILDPGDPRMLRSVLGRFATGVAVVTTMTEAGEPVGMTVNSFTSVSLNPPLVLFCVSHKSCLYPAFAAAEHTAVNILGESQIAVSWQFSAPGFDRFDAIRPRFGANGAPLLPNALATLECRTEQRMPAGDHDVVIGRVTALETSSNAVSQPLLYYGGNYRSLNHDHEWWSVAFE